MKTMKSILVGWLLLITVYIPLNVDAQSPTITGSGQLTVRPDGADVIDMFSFLDFLPQYKANTKSVTITQYYLVNDAGDLRRRTFDGIGHTTILYDEQGKIIKIDNAVKLNFQYEGTV